MTESALMALLIKVVQDNHDIDIDFLEAYYRKALDQQLDDSSILDMTRSDDYVRLQSLIDRTKSVLKCKSRTARLWLLYLDYIGVVKLFIHAERSSNWMLHLQTTKKMLNLFAATGHSNYAKCTGLYLQEMYDLPEQHPWLHEQFM